MDKTLKYLQFLTDNPQGIVQFSLGYEKDYRYGYAIEDQARALIATLYLEDQSLIKLYIQTIKRCPASNGVKMLWDESGNFQEKTDNFGEASAEVIWALGNYLEVNSDAQAKEMYQFLIRGVSKSPWPRSWAYALLGSTKMKDEKFTKLLADKLVKKFQKYSSDEWSWFEEKITYANALFPWALLESYELTKNEDYKMIALKSLDFLLENCIKDQVPVVVGNEGWWEKGKIMPLYGQQPIDISYLCLCCLRFYELTSQGIYLEKAIFYYSWFLGNNLKGLKMIRSDGACYDGLTEQGVNPNGGAESTICLLLAQIALNPYISPPIQPQKQVIDQLDLML